MNLRRQLPVYSPLTTAALRRALLSGFTPGRNGQETFRAELETAYHADEAVLFGSGTQALQVAIEWAMRLENSRRVALPAFSCFDVAAAAVGARARVRCYDIEPATLNPDFASLRRLLEDGVRVVVISPLYGYPVDWDAVADLVQRFDAIAIEDAAQGNHAFWRARPLGSLGTLSVLSFGRGKGWTGGTGGALLLRESPNGRTPRDAPLPRRTAEARVVGMLAVQWALSRPSLYALPRAIPWLRLGETTYHPPAAPQPMTRAAAACLLASQPAAEQEAAARRTTATMFLPALKDAGSKQLKTIEPLAGARPGFLRLPLRFLRGCEAGEGAFAEWPAASRLGLERSYPATLPQIRQLQPSLEQRDRVPGAEELVRTLCTVPTHSLLRPAERRALIEILERYARHRDP